MQVYTDIDRRLHLLCQVLAKTNRTYVGAKADDSHTNLFYDHNGNIIYGRWIDTKNGKFVFAMNLHQWSIECLDESFSTIDTISVEGKKIEELEINVEQTLKRLGLNTESFKNPLHYHIPHYKFLENAFEKPPAKHIEIWEGYRTIANLACFYLLEKLEIDSEIRIWPHHFDTGIYIEPNGKVGLGFGLAMQDDLVGSPYFYFRAYGINGFEFNYNIKPQLENGVWVNTSDFKGFVLDLNSKKNVDLNIVTQFVDNGLPHYVNDEA